mmetsp:Transcript_24336/g.68186  ORF Transcript_24336/g.68186 Transcript_24336/m.68186 type:complete len:770 (+) Transcript_24336:116-2425(+)|eukprot:CAMPEP_0119131368 /NCGR_PEP_ID=MMETSP1310-20130426/10167_1 /TAXON_ID=464262 /ORGANISM="Genus nov. species nov., Strain RCC2339" /LENGTH=769 /DNA_ID=CAMNT_0007121935 /DNA_START=60 /DNA_END=2369 /DNA_ORIENTATION=-
MEGSEETATYTCKEFGFSFEYPKGWNTDPVDLNPIDMSQAGDIEGVVEQIKVAGIRPANITAENFETHMEEILVMKQVLTERTTLDGFTTKLQGDMAKTYIQLRQMGVEESVLSDEISIQETTMGHLEGRCAVLPLFLPVPQENGMMVLLKRPTYQKWCIMDNGKSSLVMMYMATEKLFPERLPAVRKLFDTMTWSAPSFPSIHDSLYASVDAVIDEPVPAQDETSLKYSWLDEPNDGASSETPAKEVDENGRVIETVESIFKSKAEQDFLQSPGKGVALIEDCDSEGDDDDLGVLTETLKEVNGTSNPASPQAPSDGDDAKAKPEAEPEAPTEVPAAAAAAEEEERVEVPPNHVPVPYRVDEPAQQGKYPEISISFAVPKGISKHELSITVTKNTIKAGVKGQLPVVEGTLRDDVLEEEVLWHREGSQVTIPLIKRVPDRWGYAVAGPRNPSDKRTIDGISLSRLAKHHAEKGEYSIAFRLFTAAADLNHLSSILLVSGVLSREKVKSLQPYNKYVPEDQALAATYFRKAAQSPHLSPLAMYQLGNAYFFGVPGSKKAPAVEQSAADAYEWLNKAAKFENTRALYLAGVLLYNGALPAKLFQEGSLVSVVMSASEENQKLTPDKRRGLMLIRRAAVLSLLDANITMGYVFLDGHLPGVPNKGKKTETNLLETQQYFNRAKALNGAGVWAGPPASYLSLVEKTGGKKGQASAPAPKKASASKAASEPLVSSEGGGGALDAVSEYGPTIAVVACAAAFGFYFYKRFSSSS